MRDWELRVSNLTAYCSCRRGRRRTICVLCRRGQIKRDKTCYLQLFVSCMTAKKHKRRRRGKDRETAQERRGSMRELHRLPLPEFIDRNTCATLSHNTAYDQYGPRPPPLCLRHVYIRTRHSSARSKLSVFLVFFFPSLRLLAHTACSGYISTGSSLTWFSDRVVISHIYI